MAVPSHVKGPLQVCVIDPADGDGIAALLRENQCKVNVLARPIDIEREVDAVVLDPAAFDGADTVGQVRKATDAAIIAVSSVDDDDYRVAVFEAGAADYVAKPVLPGDLTARIRLRVTGSALAARPPLAISPDGRSIMAFGQPLLLTRREQDLLEFLMARPRMLVTRDEILEAIWGPGWPSSSVVTEYIRRLRSELSRYGLDRCILTRHGFGYVFLPEPEPARR